MPLSEARQRALLVACVFIDLTAVSLVLPLLPAKFRAFGVSKRTYGLISSVYSLSQIVGGLILGAVADRRLGRRGLLLLNFAGAALAYAIVGAPRASLGLLVASRVVVGLCKQTMTAGTALMTELTAEGPERALWVGRVSSAAQTAWVAARPSAAASAASERGRRRPSRARCARARLLSARAALSTRARRAPRSGRSRGPSLPPAPKVRAPRRLAPCARSPGRRAAEGARRRPRRAAARAARAAPPLARARGAARALFATLGGAGPAASCRAARGRRGRARGRRRARAVRARRWDRRRRDRVARELQIGRRRACETRRPRRARRRAARATRGARASARGGKMEPPSIPLTSLHPTPPHAMPPPSLLTHDRLLVSCARAQVLASFCLAGRIRAAARESARALRGAAAGARYLLGVPRARGRVRARRG